MKGKLFSVVLGLVAAVTVSCGGKADVAGVEPAGAVAVRLEKIEATPVEDYYEAVGTVRSRTTSAVSAMILGRVTAVPVGEGDRVRRGNTLVEIDDSDARARLQKAEAGLRDAETGVEEAERAIRVAEAAATAANASRKLAAATFDRYSALIERRSVSRQEFDEVETRLKIAEAEADRAAKMLSLTKTRKDQALARVDQAKAEVVAARIHVGYSRIVSPINGIVTGKQVEVGQTASPGMVLLTVEDDTNYRLEAAVEETRIGAIQVDAPVRVLIDALGDLEIQGRVVQIVPAADQASRSYTVKIELDTPKQPQTLRSGLFGRARFPTGSIRVITIPRQAIVQRGQLVGVYIADESGLAHLRLIKLGKPHGERVEVLAGLSGGERIVVDGVGAVSEGGRIAPREGT